MDISNFRKQVLQRYNLPAIYQINEFHGDGAYLEQSSEFISLLARCFEDESTFRSSDFNDVPMDILMDYIRRTHRLYLDKSLQEIEQSIDLLQSAYPSGHPLLAILNDFYLEYKTDLIVHIRKEDQKLLPYIQFLENSLKGGFNAHEFFLNRQRFSIQSFIENHAENDTELEEVKAKILLYEPPLMNRFIYGVLIQQLEFFRQDLTIHGMIEDRVLIPRALDMEHRLEAIFSKTARLN